MGAGWPRCAGAQLTQRTTRAGLGTHRAQRARGLGRQVRPVPWRPKVRFHLGESRVCRSRKRATCCPLGIATEGQHAASGCNFGAQRPAVGHRGIGASELRASSPSGAHSPEGSKLAGIHLRETPSEARGGGVHHAGWKLKSTRAAGHRSRVRSAPGSTKTDMPDHQSLNKVARADFPLQDEWGANNEMFESKEHEPNKACLVRMGNTPLGGWRRRAAASGP